MREKERERNICMWLPLTHPQVGTWPTTQQCALTGNWTGNPLFPWLALNPLSYTSQRGQLLSIFERCHSIAWLTLILLEKSAIHFIVDLTKVNIFFPLRLLCSLYIFSPIFVWNSSTLKRWRDFLLVCCSSFSVLEFTALHNSLARLFSLLLKHSRS